IIALLPYRLTAQDRLPGYAAGDAFSPETAVTSALVRSSPAERLAAYQNAGFVVRRSQRLVPAAPPAAIPGANGVFHTLLFADQHRRPRLPAVRAWSRGRRGETDDGHPPHLRLPAGRAWSGSWRRQCRVA
ncbi:MAG TPA: hypothetical protein VK821_18440, partial [Dehalococcoidia bacterium]|nr:hypothetical protein [Dehalococcoidia bacterium]